MKSLIRPALACALAALVVAPAAARDVLLFPYFDSNGENGVFLAASEDGRAFESLNGGEPVFTPPRWAEGQHLTRDPSIVWHDGLFHMVWTSNWSGRWFGYASSPDLKTWSEPRRVQPFAEGHEQPKNVWAPEVFRDHVAGDFKVVWSSTLPSELTDGDGSEDSHRNDHRMYYVATTDFESFTEPQLLFNDENYSVIDAQVAWDEAGDRWAMALKKETPPNTGGKNLRLAFSPREITPESFTDTTEPVVGPGTAISGRDAAEGPTLVHFGGEWLLYWDSYGAGRYSLAVSPDLEGWTDATDTLTIDARHPRHGTLFVAGAENVAWLNGDGADAADDEINVAMKPFITPADFVDGAVRGFTKQGGDAAYHVEGDQVVGVSKHGTPNTFLCSDKTYGDFVMEFDVKIDPGLNSGVQIRSECFDEPKTVTATPPGGEPREYRIPAGRVHGYQVEIDPSNRAWSGGVYDEARRGWLDNLEGDDNAAARAAFKPDGWNHYRVVAQGDRIRTWVNGVPAADLTDDQTAEGFIALQVHGIGNPADAGKSIRWRNLRIGELD